MDQCWRLQPEPTALFLYEHKTKDKKAGLSVVGRQGQKGAGAGEDCELGLSVQGPGELGKCFPIETNAEAPLTTRTVK